jgi:hypothetical protein
VEASKDKQDKYREVIKDILPENIVYIDESGIELAICKDRGWGKKSEKLVAKKSGKYYKRSNIRPSAKQGFELTQQLRACSSIFMF